MDFDHERVTADAANDWWWYAIYAVLAVAGLVVQLREASRLTSSMRESWAAGRGRPPAPSVR